MLLSCSDPVNSEITNLPARKRAWSRPKTSEVQETLQIASLRSYCWLFQHCQLRVRTISNVKNICGTMPFWYLSDQNRNLKEFAIAKTLINVLLRTEWADSWQTHCTTDPRTTSACESSQLFLWRSTYPHRKSIASQFECITSLQAKMHNLAFTCDLLSHSRSRSCSQFQYVKVEYGLVWYFIVPCVFGFRSENDASL